MSFNGNVVVLPNYFNDDLWRFKKPSVNSEQEGITVIGYMGGRSHQPDLNMIMPALLRLSKQYPGKLQFNFWGIRPPAELAQSAQVRWYYPDTRSYPDFAAYFQTQAADIFIGPLYNNLFNSCKSPIKYFEYSALGAPGVFSRMGPYLDVITHEQDGLLASSLEEWTDCLTRLIEDHELRLMIATNAQETIKSKWLLSKNASLWLDAFQKASINTDIKNTDKSSFLHLVKSLSQQIVEEQNYKNDQIDTLTNRVHDLAPLIAERGLFALYIKLKVYWGIKKDLDLIRSSGLFDEKWYLDHNPDMVRAKVDPMLHFLRHGGHERRNPGPHFSSGWYLDSYEDVRASGLNPLVHFLKYGLPEGRLTDSDQTAQELSAQVLFRRFHPIRATLIPRGSRRERLFLGLRKVISSGAGVFTESRIIRTRYILKNYGMKSLIETIVGWVKAKLWGNAINKDFIARVRRYSPVARVKARTKRIQTQWAKYSANIKLRKLLSSNAMVKLPETSEPVISIILLFHNRAEMSLQCLESLAEGAGNVPFEVVIVDNASTDETPALLDHIQNAKIIRNTTNTGFGGGCNQAVDLAAGKYLLFLNNDTRLLPNSIQILVDTLESSTDIGAVGGKLIFPDGRLQEAGSIIWQDGTCLGYGRYDDPFTPEFSYVRDVDFCSGALLLTPRELFLSLGKFDPRYAPAYYEDADYCLQLWMSGYRVVFQPFATAIHYEFGSSGTDRALALQTQHRQIFVQKWGGHLTSFDLPDPAKIISAREHKSDTKRILFIDDRIPDYRIGHGYPRTYRMLELLAEMGYKLTFLPLQLPTLVPDIARPLQMLGIEVFYKKTDQDPELEFLYDDPDRKIDIQAFLASRLDYYDVVFVSRPHNMQEIAKYLKTYARQATIVYDAEAIFSLRDLKYRELNGEHIPEAEKDKLIKAEVAIIKDAQAVTTVSELEKEQFLKYGASSVHVLGHIIEPKPTPASFEERKDILFIGSILFDPSPNGDAIRYFVNQILPLVREKVHCEFYIVGTNRIQSIWNMESKYVHVVGKVEDLTPYYNRSRLFVVPTRFSAGIPLKLLEASANGLPAVVTPLTAWQLGWREDHDLLVGHNPKDFARKVIDLYTNPDLFYSLRQNALDRLHEEYSPEQFRKTLQHILTSAMDKSNTENSWIPYQR